MKRFMAIILSVTLLCTLIPAASAATSDQESAAQALYGLGLFQGTGSNADGTPNFDLDRTPTRAEAVTMLVRLLGKDAEAKAGTWETPFTDVADWAKPYVGYAYANGLTTGTSDTTFGGDATVNATQYLTFVLRALGYTSGTDFQWDSAWTKSDEIKLTAGRYNADTTSFTRGDVAEISYTALSTQKKNEAQTLGATLGIDGSSGAKNVLSTESLQGVWQFENGTSSGDPDSIYYEEFTFEGDDLTYVRYYGSKSAGEFGASKISAIDYKVGTFTVEDDKIVFNITKYTYTYGTEVLDGSERTEKYTVPNFTGDGFHCNTDGWRVGICRKVSEASRTRYAERLIERIARENPKLEIILANTDSDDPELNDLLMTHYESNYDGTIDSVWKMSDFHYDSDKNYDKTYTVTLYISGEWLKDKFGGNVSGTKSCDIEWQLYDENQEYVIDSGTIYSPKVYAGGKFKDAHDMIFNLPGGTYYLILS